MSRDMYADVKEFAKGPAQQTAPDAPVLHIDAATKVDLLQKIDWAASELGETHVAVQKGDIAGIMDGALDLVYVALGFCVRLGIPPYELWDRIHAANMTKVPGDESNGFKARKPPGFVPPDIAGGIAEIAARAKGGAE